MPFQRSAWKAGWAACLLWAFLWGPTPSATAERARGSEGIRYPDNVGVIDITHPPYNARGDGKTDVTAIINRALKEHNAATSGGIFMAPTIYFPAGTYLVSDTLVPRDPRTPEENYCSVRILGQGRDQTVIKLRDNAPGFQHKGRPRYVLRTGNRGRGPNAGFGNYIQHLTIDVGRDNPGAIGIRYDVANCGAMEYVDIRSSDPQKDGRYGLAFHSVCGAGYVNHVTIDGFDEGIHFPNAPVNNIVFEYITLQNQRRCGILNAGKNIQIRALRSLNDVPALKTRNQWAATVLVNADLRSRSPNQTAAIVVEDGGFLFARAITTDGYRLAIDVDAAARKADVKGGRVAEWLSHDPLSTQRPGPTQSLNLPVKNAPRYHHNKFELWADVRDYGATPDDNRNDDAPGIQAAIDSGKEIVCLPRGTYMLRTPVVLRGSVRKLDGLFSRLMRPKGNEKAALIARDIEAPAVVIENLVVQLVPIVHDSANVTVIRHRAGSGLITCGQGASGDLFVEDAGPHVRIEVKNGIQAWFRQINREQAGMENDGSTVWFLGDNIERMYSKPGRRLVMNPIRTINGGITELLGGALDPLHYPHRPALGPLIECINSRVSVTYAGNIRRRKDKEGSWQLHVKEVRNGEVTRITRGQVHITDKRRRFVLPLYTSPPLD